MGRGGLVAAALRTAEQLCLKARIAYARWELRQSEDHLKFADENAAFWESAYWARTRKITDQKDHLQQLCEQLQGLPYSNTKPENHDERRADAA